MSPLWGFGYKHAAPLGLNAAQLAARYPLWGRGLLAQRVGEPNPYAYNFACSRSNFRASRIRHAAPGGKCGTIGGAVSIVGERSPRPAGWGTQPLRIQLCLLTFQFSCLPGLFWCMRLTCRPSGAKCGTIGGAVSIVGERSPRPAGWGTQPLRIQLCFFVRYGSNVSPLWGPLGYLVYAACYKHVAPLGLKIATPSFLRVCVVVGR